MKSFLPLTFLLIFNSCASVDTSRIAPGYAEAFKAINQVLFGVNNSFPPEVIKNIPYASMLVKIGNGPSALMILESKNNDSYTWVSADGIYLVINNGKIIKTYGLNNNLKERLLPRVDWDQDLLDEMQFTSYSSFSQPTLNNLPVISTYSARVSLDTKLFFDTKKLYFIEEKIVSESIGWEETNKYWVDDTNFVWKSVQHISPRLPKITFEVTKKPL